MPWAFRRCLWIVCVLRWSACVFRIFNFVRRLSYGTATALVAIASRGESGLLTSFLVLG